jgi:hypothetical protein
VDFFVASPVTPALTGGSVRLKGIEDADDSCSIWSRSGGRSEPELRGVSGLQHGAHDFSVYIGEPEITTRMPECQPLVIDAQEMEQGGVEIMHVNLVHRGTEAVIVRRSVRETAPDAASRHPDCETIRVMISSVGTALSRRGPAEFAAPDDEGVLEHAQGFEIGKQTGDWFVDFGGIAFVITGEVLMLIPLKRMIHLDEPDTLLSEAPRQEALAPERIGGGFVDSVQLQGGTGFAPEIRCLGGGGLHAKGEFVGFDQTFELPVLTGGLQVLPVHALQQVQLFPLNVPGQEGVPDVSDLRVIQGSSFGSNRGALKHGRQEGGSVVLGSSVECRWTDGDESRQILIFGAETVDQPRAKAGSDLAVGAGVQVQNGLSVILAIRVQTPDQAEVVGGPGDPGEEIADFETARAALAEFPPGGEQLGAGACALTGNYA